MDRNHVCSMDLVSRKTVEEVTRHIITLRQLTRSCNSFFRHRKGLRTHSCNISEMSCFKIIGSRYQKSNLSQNKNKGKKKSIRRGGKFSVVSSKIYHQYNKNIKDLFRRILTQIIKLEINVIQKTFIATICC